MKMIVGIPIILASITWAITMIKSGWSYSYGLGFWGANGHDGVWHIALANNLSKFNIENPVFAGEIIKNYHIGFDLILAMLHVITRVRMDILYFQILPPIFALLIGYLSYVFVFSWTKSRYSALCTLHFVYFAGSIAWLLGKGESAFWSQQSISTLINPPFALSLILILSGLIFLLKKKRLLAILCFGVLIQIKVYAGLLVLAALFVSSIYSYYILHTTYYIRVFLGTLVVSLLLFLPFNNLSTGLVYWQPFWFLETMMSYSDRLGWQKFYSAMTSYKMGHIWMKGIFAYGAALLIFILGNFWTRLIFLKDIFRKLDSVKVFMLTVIAAGVVIPTFFVQSGTPWNTIQFMYYSLFFAGILAGISLSQYTKYYILYTFVLLTIPTTILTLKDVYIPNRPPAMLSNYEFEALNFLKNQEHGIVLTYPYDVDKAREAESDPPRPLYLYESSAYVSAFSEKQTFLEDEVNLNITGYGWRERKKEVLDWYKEENQEKAREFLKVNNIKYIYWIMPQRALLGDSQLGLEKIFENKKVIIYKYDGHFSSN